MKIDLIDQIKNPSENLLWLILNTPRPDDDDDGEATPVPALPTDPAPVQRAEAQV